MVWDDYYGKQANPYTVDDFRRILVALEASGDVSDEMVDLMARTREALRVEGDEF